MDCVVCKEPMIVVERFNIELDYCVSCHSIWFDSSELDLLAKAVRPGMSLPDFSVLPLAHSDEKIRTCPRCDTAMDKIEISKDPPLVIDICRKNHGYWFDRDELGQFFERLDDESLVPHDVVEFLGEVIGVKK